MSYGLELNEAMSFAHELHQHQKRKGTSVPYLTHLLGVAALVGDHGGTQEQVIAALLHDALEDQGKHRPGLAEEIEARFGAQVLAMVRAVSDTEQDPKPPWLARKQHYIDHLKAAPDDDPSLLISAADKLYNARTILRDHRLIGDEIFARFKASKAQTLWYYEQVCQALKTKDMGGPLQRGIVAELEQVVAQLKAT